MKFKTKPVIKEAFRWMIDEVPQWWRDAKEIEIIVSTGVAVIPTFEGKMQAQPGDYIIQGLNGELYPCKPDVFEKSYEPV